jgi:hypothetical protein
MAQSFVESKLKRDKLLNTMPNDKGFVSVKMDQARPSTMLDSSSFSSPKKKRTINDAQIDALIRKEKLNLLAFTQNDI